MSHTDKDLETIFSVGASAQRYNAFIRMAVQETLPGGMMERAKIYAALAQTEATYLTGG